MKDLQAVTNPGKTGQAEVDRALQELSDGLNLLRRQAVTGVTIEGITVTASPTVIKVNHGLGRRPNGWFVIRSKYATPNALHEVSSPNPDKELHLHYTGSTDIVLDIRVT